MRVLLLIAILPWLAATDELCPDRKTTCSEGKSCCEFDGFYTCCDPTTGEIEGHLLPVDTKYTYSNLTVQRAPGYEVPCDNGMYCNMLSICCGPYCCEMSGSCCNNRGCCAPMQPCCGDGCCGALTTCCGGQGCCAFMSKCCGSWCCPSKSRCGTESRKCYNSSAGLVPTLALISMLVAACFVTKSSLL
ncbi:hypothetical protein CDAR_14701 [Caerostris darwini]|uniref:Granulin n=1 Tax=Caerostris darwini TaxID=1538125 RepID=A0AAV4QZE1_9ARAC|nr:hypothetical protein CDAR_14701 [Caerostris darwini]